jgi:hypothetical protein
MPELLDVRFAFYYRGWRVFVFSLISGRDAAIAGLSE